MPVQMKTEFDRRTVLMLGAGAMALFGGAPEAQGAEMKELAPGVTIKTLREVDSTIPGFSKARLHEITFRPGSKFGPQTLKTVNVCEIRNAPLNVSIKGQRPFTLQPGDIYACPVGWVETDTNTSNKPSIMRVVELQPA